MSGPAVCVSRGSAALQLVHPLEPALLPARRHIHQNDFYCTAVCQHEHACKVYQCAMDLQRQRPC